MALSANSKQAFLTDALRAYSENFTLLDDRNPFRLRLNGQAYSIHVSSIHDESRGKTDGRRIQVTQGIRITQQEREDAGQVALFIGLFPDGRTFSAWEPAHALGQENNSGGSLYSYWSHQQLTVDQGAAFKSSFSTKLGRNVHTISMRSSALGFYLENGNKLHRATSADELQRIIKYLDAYLEQPDPGARTESSVIIAGHKEKVTVTRTSYPRDPKFSDSVLAAYEHACAICGRQLGLVEAAHIIPHNEADCPNHVTNGIALCTEHHKLYDAVLLLPHPNGTLYVNPAKVEHLEKIGQSAGLADIKNRSQTPFRLPKNVAHHPNPKYLERGLNIRLGKGG